VLPAASLCVFASPRADDAKAEGTRALREAGFTLWAWSALQPQATPPPDYDLLVVFGSCQEFGEAGTAALVALLRQAWLQGITIGLFGAADLLAAADIAPPGAPIESAGLFIGDALPSGGTVQEMADAVQAGPHLER
jgi:hypothetical protein